MKRVPASSWLALVVAASALLRLQLSRDSPAPWIFVDELVYSELAKSLAAGGELLVRDTATAGYGVVYPLLISPAWALFDSVPDAYAAAKAINAVLISLAAVPAYALARRLVGQGAALAAAVLAVALPSLAYSGTIMTENAFYPLFLVVVLSLVLVLERPTAGRQLVLVALLGLAFLTRPQAVALAAAVLTAPLLQGLLGRRVRAAVAAQRLLYVVAGAVLLLVPAVQLGRGESVTSVLGAYAVVGEGGYEAGAVARYLLYHVAELDLYVGVAPAAAAALLVVCARGKDVRLDAFLAASIAVSVWLLLVVSTFASKFSDRILERNVFYLVPLVLIALLAWIERGAPRPPRATAVAAVVAGALPGALPFERLLDVQAIGDTLMLLPLWRLEDYGLETAELAAVVVPASILAAALVLFLPRRLAPVLPVLVLAYFLVALVPIEQRFERVSRGALDSGISNERLDWIDRAVPAGAEVSFLWLGGGDVYDLWLNEFFNRSVGTVYSIAGPLPGGFARTDLQIDEQAGILRGSDGRSVQPRYVLVDGSFTPSGRVVARDEQQGLALYELDGPLRSAATVTGLYPGNTWSGPRVTYTRRDCRGGSLRVHLRGDPSLFAEPQTVTATVDGREAGRVTFEPSERAELLVPLLPSGGRCVVELSVTPTGVPAELTSGANPDTRVLGVHFDRFDYVRP
ncbi:MAG TPA: glycosyltransferase family 39 protein [Gaiellaceae bacterium]|nr:glycosyltransferase family 39 protein [Gaiellaceae bacterium]